MSRFELVAGDFGRGKGRYRAGLFTFPKGGPRGIEEVESVESNATIMQRDWFGAARGAVKGAAASAPVGAIATIFASPIKAIITAGPAALTAGAIGAGIGAVGGGTKNMSLMQIAFRDGLGFVAIAPVDLPDAVLEDSELAVELIKRQARILREAAPKSWFGFRKAEAPPLPPPPQEITVGAAAGVLLTAASDAAASAASATVDVAGDAIGGAIGYMRRQAGI
ncbi:MAG TPA: hypothetical protein VF744_06875 [Beijerinckiaceae bacterium]|jgi:hypothetical protein